MARIGIFGGSFNPPHIGHVRTAEQFRKEMSLDRLLVIPAAIPPHKSFPEGTPSPETRLALCRSAMETISCVTVSDIEIRREGTSYSAETIEELRLKYPHDELFLLVGTDMFLTLHTWYCPEIICKECTIVAAWRENMKKKDYQAVEKQKELLKEKYRARVVFLENEITEISSTDVRRMLLLESAEELLTSETYSMIRSAGLYVPDSFLKHLPVKLLRERSRLLLKDKRVPHVLGCEETAVQLGLKYGLNTDLLSRAAILHDVTKAIPDSMQLILCRNYGIVMSNADRKAPPVWHALTGSGAALHVFDECAEISTAIRRHTTGAPGMTPEDMALYLADMIEPTRSFPGVEKIRETAFRSLEAGMEAALESTISHVGENNSSLHPDSLNTLKWLTGKSCG